MTKGEYESRIQTVCLAILTIVTIAVTLYLLRAVLVPFMLAVFLTLILIPIVDFLMRKLKINRMIALVLTLFLGFLSLLGVGSLIWVSVDQFADNADVYEEQLLKLFERAQSSLPLDQLASLMSEPNSVQSMESGEVGVEGSDEPGLVSDEPKRRGGFDASSLLPKSTVKSLIENLLTGIRSVVSNGLLVMLFTAFLVTGSTSRTKPRGGVVGEIESRVQKYISIKIVLSLLTGALVFLILKILGVDYAMSFGVFAFILNFVPNVGSLIATLLPLPVVLLTPDVSVATVVLAILLPITVQFVIGNVIEPKIMGDTLGLHPVVILMALTFWFMLWGFPGMLLAAPMTAIAKIVFHRIEVTKPLAGLMEGRLETLDEM